MIKQLNKSGRVASWMFAFFLIGLATYIFFDPVYCGDMLAYMGLAKGVDQHNLIELHHEIYEEAKNHIPPNSYKRLTDSTYSTLFRMHNDPAYYYSTLPYYAVKPFYIQTIRFFHFFGINIVKSLILVTCMSVLLLGTLIFTWIQKFVPAYQALILSGLLLMCSPIVVSISMTTPDPLSAFFFLLAAYSLFEKKSMILAVIALLLAIYTRLDFIIPAVFIMTLMLFRREIKFKYYLTILFLFVIAFFSITIPLKRYSWNPLFYPDYASHYRLDFSGVKNKLYSYFDLLISAFKDVITDSGILVFFFIALFAIFTSSIYRRLNYSSDIWIFICMGLIILVRIMLHPYISDRFFISYYFILSILAIKSIRLNPSQ